MGFSRQDDWSGVPLPSLGLQKEILLGLGKWTLLFYASKLLSLDSTQTSWANFCHLHRSDILANHYSCWSPFPHFAPPPFKVMPIMQKSSKSSEWHWVRITKSQDSTLDMAHGPGTLKTGFTHQPPESHSHTSKSTSSLGAHWRRVLLCGFSDFHGVITPIMTHFQLHRVGRKCRAVVHHHIGCLPSRI